MSSNKKLFFFKNQFRHLTFYSIPFSILLILRKRLNFILLILFFLSTFFITTF